MALGEGIFILFFFWVHKKITLDTEKKVDNANAFPHLSEFVVDAQLEIKLLEMLKLDL